jgi:hypothetical protein
VKRRAIACTLRGADRELRAGLVAQLMNDEFFPAPTAGSLRQLRTCKTPDVVRV